MKHNLEAWQLDNPTDRDIDYCSGVPDICNKCKHKQRCHELILKKMNGVLAAVDYQLQEMNDKKADY